MHKIIYFSAKKYKKTCVPTLTKISDLLPETHIFYLALNTN